MTEMLSFYFCLMKSLIDPKCLVKILQYLLKKFYTDTENNSII